APDPTGAWPATAMGCALLAQNGGASSAGDGAASNRATAALVTAMLGGWRTERSVANRPPSQNQRWSARWPLIITAARSLPATATLRLAGQRAFVSSPSVGTRSCIAESA